MAKKIRFEGLQPEFLSNEKTWLEFMEALSDTIQEQVRDPIGEIEDLRHIVEDTDPVVISNTIKQLGFDIPADLIKHNTKRLSKSVYMLALFHEISGTEDFVQGVQYVLGREILVKHLWTNNYLDFYVEPGGPKLADGGDWYKTPHIELGMEMIPTDVNLVLPEGSTLTDRLLAAYYEFAPINQVVKDFYFIIPVEATIGLAGKLYFDHVDYGVIGLGSETVEQVATLAPDEVVSGERFQVLADVRFGSSDPVITKAPTPAPAYKPRLAKQAIKVLPVAGVHESIIDDNLGIEFLDQELSANGQSFTLEATEGHYGYLAVPADLGTAFITDSEEDDAVHWNGASWNGKDFGTTFGPIVVSRTVNDKTSDWYLYRTDRPSFGRRTFNVVFTQDLETELQSLALIQSDIDLSSGGRVVRIPSPEYSTDRPDIVRFNDLGQAIFATVQRDTVVGITTTVNGISNTKNLTVKATGTRLNYIRLHGPDVVNGDDIFDVTVDGYYSDGHVRPIDNAEIKVISPYVLQKQGYSIDTGNPPEDAVLYVEALFLDRSNIEHTSTKDIILKAVSTNVVVTQLDILGPDVLSETNSYQYQAHAFFSDGTDRFVLVLWESSSPLLHVDQDGLATAGSPQDAFKAALKATLQFNGEKYIATKQIEVTRNYITPVSMEIRGPDRVVELSEMRYSAFMTWSNGAVTKVNPEWSSDRFSIDSSGTLISGSVGNPISVSVQARAQGLIANKIVAVFDTPINIEYITVIGPENLKENITGKYRAFAHFTDNRDVEIVPDWSIVGNPNFAQIDQFGFLTFSDPTVGIVEIYAEYDNGLTAYTQTKPIVLIPDVSLISGLVISGPSEVLEGKRITLTATALYEDGTTEIVRPVWGARSPDPLNIPEPAVDTVSPGVVQGRSVEENTVAIVTARFFKEYAEFPVLVKDYERLGPDAPLFSRIIGPTALRATETGSYSLLTVFDNGCNQELALSNEWSLNVPPEVAIIDQNGFLRSVDGKTTDITISADWGCYGHTIHEEFEVRIVEEESTLGDLVIYGPERILEQSITNYVLELFRKGQPVVENTGERPYPNEIEWFLDTQIVGVDITNSGSLFVADVPNGTQIIIRAVMTEGFHTIEESKLITVGQLLPAYGTGPIGISDGGEIDQYLTQYFNDIESGESFTVTAPAGEYVYFAAPVSYGLATFVIGGGSVTGGMDGATWPNDGSIGLTTGPLTITRISGGVSTDWYLYRSDFAGIGTTSLTVYFDQT